MTMTATKRPQGAASARRRPAEVTAAVKPIAAATAEANGLVLWGVTFLREAGRETLRVAADKLGGIGSDELARFSEALSRAIDHADAVPGEATYVLEVTSPGAERKLESPEQFAVCVGRIAKISLNDGSSLEGEIEGVDGTDIQIDGRTIAFGDVARARMVVKL